MSDIIDLSKIMAGTEGKQLREAFEAINAAFLAGAAGILPADFPEIKAKIIGLEKDILKLTVRQKDGVSKIDIRTRVGTLETQMATITPRLADVETRLAKLESRIP